MKKFVVCIFLCVGFANFMGAQNYTPRIEPCPCLMKIDSGLKSVCGYLVVPENRQKANDNKIKIPFVFARRPEQSATKDIILFTTGGPGYASIQVGDSLKANSPYFLAGGFIFFDQRGTKNAKPCLDCEGIDEAVIRAYKENLPKDSLVGLAVKQCRQKFSAQGVDLSAYTTIESAADINDLRKVLNIESLTLTGISYSGGLMQTVVRNHPEGIKSIILNSPLPSFVNYEEHALSNINEALNFIFSSVEADSAQNARYPNLKQRFQQYFTSISNKKFSFKYTEKQSSKVLKLQYTKDELLGIVVDRIYNDQYQTVPSVIADLINGKHETYIKESFDNIFGGNKNISYGMRLSVYCTEQILHSDTRIEQQQNTIFPWLSGYSFNDPNHAICDCWNVKPEPPIAKTPVYSTIPALVTAGSIDPWCGVFYSRLIKRTMPNAQVLIFKNKAHGTGYGDDFNTFLGKFLKNPYEKLVSDSKDISVE